MFINKSLLGSMQHRVLSEPKIFSKFVFSASIKLSGNQRTYLYSGGSGLSIDIHFVDIELSYDVLSPLPIVLSKHFNHPHPYIEIATAISDYEPNLTLVWHGQQPAIKIIITCVTHIAQSNGLPTHPEPKP